MCSTLSASSRGARSETRMMTFVTIGSSLDDAMHGKNAKSLWLLGLRLSKAFVTSVVSDLVFAVKTIRAWHNRDSICVGPVRIRGYCSCHAFYAS